MASPDSQRLDRRTAVKWMLTAAASTTLFGVVGAAENAAASAVRPVGGHGYGTDPDLQKNYQPGDLWPLTFTDRQRAAAAALCAVIIPRDDRSPSAEDLKVHDFIDEWISAPYAAQAEDRPGILEGLAWLDDEARRRFSRDFSGATLLQKTAICDDLADPNRVAPEFGTAAKFFTRFRELTASGFYTTPEGMKDIGYVGNMPLASFDGPPATVLRKLGLE